MTKTANAEVRSPKDGPWLWMTKAAITMIRSGAKEFHEHALTIYMVLCEAASNQQSETFTLSIGRCAKLAFIGKKTARGAIRELTRIGLIEVVRERTDDGMRNLPCRFTLLAIKTTPQTDNHAPKTSRKRPASTGLDW